MAPDLPIRRSMGTLAMLILLAGLTAVQAVIFPTECVNQWNGTRVMCCPSFNNSRCGSKDNRGSCMPIAAPREAPPRNVGTDLRYGYPGSMFNATCQCKPNFMGPACGECALGLKGAKCDQPNKVIRRNAKNLTDAEFTNFLAQLHYCKYKLDLEYSILRAVDRFHTASYEFLTVSFYDQMCFIHSFITAPFIVEGQEIDWTNYGHGGSGFFPWHRLYMMLFERQIQKCLNDPSWGLIYYEWQYENPRECEMCHNGRFGATDHQGRISPGSVLSHWKMVCGGLEYPGAICLMSDYECERDRIVRQVGLDVNFKSTNEDIQACLNLPYDTPGYNTSSVNSMRNCLEGFWNPLYGFSVTNHNLLHMFIAGTMGYVPGSCNDILFYVHHCNMDKILELYIYMNGISPADYPTDNYMYGHGANDCIGPFMTCYKNKAMLVPLSSTYNIYYG